MFIFIRRIAAISADTREAFRTEPEMVSADRDVRVEAFRQNLEPIHPCLLLNPRR
jgi:hypothetical protein